MTEKIETHVEDAENRLVTQYKNKTNFKDIIDVFSQRDQDLEDVFDDLLEKRNIYTAEGVQLDKLGEILNTPRQSLNDDDYRGLLFIKIGQYNSSGTIEEIISLVNAFVRPEKLEYFEYFPATFALNALNPNLFIPAQDINLAIRNSKCLGVRFEGVITYVDNYFGFFDDPIANTFGDNTDPLIGGVFASII